MKKEAQIKRFKKIKGINFFDEKNGDELLNQPKLKKVSADTLFSSFSCN